MRILLPSDTHTERRCKLNPNSRRHGINRLKALREFTEARAEEMDGERGRFERLASKSAAPRVVSAHQLFQTPPAIADQLAELLDGRPFGRVLEPSAGLGRMYSAIRKRNAACEVTLVDESRECCAELYRITEGDQNAKLIAGDFLAMGAGRLGGLFDSIVMNPPFKNGLDIRHVRHAITLLAPVGRLVSLCANGERRKTALGRTAQRWIDLPANSFASEGTRVDAAIVVFQNS